MSWVKGTATDVGDFLAKLDAFLTVGHSLEPAYSGTGDGRIDGLIGTAASVVETITVTLTSATAFDVAGSVSGALGSGTVATAFSSAVCAFTLNAGGTAWAAGDTVTFTMTPPWAQKRGTAGQEYIYAAPGNDGASAIYAGFSRFSSVGGDYDNLRLGGFTGFDATQAFGGQPGAITRPILPLLRVGSFAYWFVATGRYCAIVAKPSTVYTSAYLGLVKQYPNPSQYPYPLAIGGCMAWANEPAAGNLGWRWSDNSGSVEAFAMAGKQQGWNSDENAQQLRLRGPDGRWMGFQANQRASSGSENTYYNFIWPYSEGMANLMPNLDGSYPLFPIVLSSDLRLVNNLPDTPNVWGELDGVYAISGQGNAVENICTVGQTDHLVVQDVFRSDRWNYFAVRLA